MTLIPVSIKRMILIQGLEGFGFTIPFNKRIISLPSSTRNRGVTSYDFKFFLKSVNPANILSQGVDFFLVDFYLFFQNAISGF